MVIKVGINGFGRIGRVVFRACFQNNNIALTAINDPAIDIEYICYLIKFDSTHGKFKRKISYTDGEIIIDDEHIKVFREKLPRNVPWHSAGVQYVVEASGMFTSIEKAKGHLSSNGVRRVIVTAPSVDVPMLILGVNEDKISTEHRVLSCASSTLYCLAPIIKILNDCYGIEEGFMTSIHAMTPSLKPLDGLCLRGKHWRDNRSIHQNIIPAKTGACKALGKIIPQVKDKVTGLAFRVPIVNVSVLDITIRLDIGTTVQDIIKSVETASKTGLRNIITVSNEDAVSSDFIGDQHSCILDIDSTMQLKPNFFKLICWYENEYSYACRVIDSILFSERQFTQSLMLVSKMTYVRPRVTKKQHEVQQTEINEISIGCNCEDVVPKVMCSTSTIKFKSPIKKYRAFYRKPLPAHHSESATVQSNASRDAKKRPDVFKTWNDDSDPPKNTRPNRDVLFNSCISFGNSDVINKPLSSKERLENVKKEFSKMLDITEDLLKKSFNNTQIENAEKFKESREIVDAEFKGDCINVLYEDSKKNVNKQDIKNGTFKECGDFYENKVDINMGTNEHNQTLYSLNILFDEGNTNPQETQIDNGFIDEKNIDGLSNDTLTNASENNIAGESAKECLLNCNSKLDMAANNRKQPDEDNCEKSYADISDKEKQSSDHNVISETYDVDEKSNNKNDSPHNNLTMQNSLITEGKPVQNNTVNFSDFKYNNENNMLILDEELKKRNIVLVTMERSVDLFDSEPVIIKADGKMEKHVASDEGVPTGFTNFLIPAELIMNDDLSGSGSAHNTETTISNGDRKLQKQDLYDKLDSVSASDSDNSFQVHERKSQVIQITDITNSTEDVSRLDKICKIIEISDELSDQLFSKLDNVENILKNQKNCKWSFNELCKTIELDEFCKKVFKQ